MKQSFFTDLRKAKVPILLFETGVIKVFAFCGMVTSELNEIYVGYRDSPQVIQKILSLDLQDLGEKPKKVACYVLKSPPSLS